MPAPNVPDDTPPPAAEGAPAPEPRRLRPRAGRQLVQLVFTGEVLEGHDPATVRAALAARMRLDERRTERLFSGKRHVLRRGVTDTAALRHIARFAQMGALLRSEPVEPRRRQARVLVQAPPPPPPPPRFKASTVALLCLALGLLAGLLLGPLRATLAPGRSAAPVAAAPERPAAARGAVTEAPAATATTVPGSPAASAATGAGSTLIAGPAAWAAVGVPMESAQTLSVAAQREYLQTYLNTRDHKAFALSDAGAHGWAAGLPDENAARDAALRRCLQHVKADDEACRIVSVNGRWDD